MVRFFVTANDNRGSAQRPRIFSRIELLLAMSAIAWSRDSPARPSRPRCSFKTAGAWLILRSPPSKMRLSPFSRANWGCRYLPIYVIHQPPAPKTLVSGPS